MKALIYLFCVVMVVLSGCSGKPEDPRLLEIAEMVSACPEEMLARLDSMDAGSMKEADRWLHTLLRIKAQDKAYVVHTSDSVILRVIDYYSRHKGSGHYPEALYYGGRVYSDIGDAPTALRYFQAALEALPEGVDDGFRATMLSQTGRLLYDNIFDKPSFFLQDSLHRKLEDRRLLQRMSKACLLATCCDLYCRHQCWRKYAGVCFPH